ncbi:MAG TPA: hypothetical protein VNO33_19815 [Kofleriaceae bacterium]|nr:hypothetical protein [Kofleriaceae bacterium]
MSKCFAVLVAWSSGCGGADESTSELVGDSRVYALEFSTDDRYLFAGGMRAEKDEGVFEGQPGFGELDLKSLYGLVSDGLDVYVTTLKYTGDIDDPYIQVVSRLPIAGGSPAILAQVQLSAPGLQVDAIAVDEADVYFTVAERLDSSLDFDPDRRAGGLFRVPKTGGEPVELLGGLVHPGSIAVDAGSVFVADQFTGTIWKTPVSGGPSEALATNEASPESLTQDDDRLYWSFWGRSDIYDILDNDGGTIRGVAKAGGPVFEVAGGHHPVGVAADATGIYWVDSGEAASSTDGSVYFVGAPGETPTVLSYGDPASSMMTADADFVYWIDPDGLVFRVPKR